MTRGKTILLIIAVAVVFAVAGVVTALYRARTFTVRPPAKAALSPGPGSALPWRTAADPSPFRITPKAADVWRAPSRRHRGQRSSHYHSHLEEKT